jgi:acyl-CoA synthetase (NDP forming)
MPTQHGDAAGVSQRDQVAGAGHWGDRELAGGKLAGAEQARREPAGVLVTPARLREFFAPRSIALVGASDTSGWARFIVAAGAAAGFAGPLIPVHPKHQTALGRPAARSLRDLAEPPDLAFILVPTDAVAEVIEDAAAGGVRNVIVLASGYREVGARGRELEDRLTARAAAAGITLLGPNCLGFINAHSGAAPFALNVPLPLTAGPVGVAMQSGALASVVLAFARSHAIGISTLTSMGNEAMISTADLVEYLVADHDTRVICLFLEEISDPAAFARAARMADQAGKPIVALKAGSSPAGQRAALAHTGSVAGDDAVVDAVLRQLNVIRVTSIEELLTTAALLGYQRVPRGRRMGVLTNSGGACDIIADRASELGIAIPEFSAPTTAAITALLPPFAAARNPLDVTGYGLANQRTSALTAIDRALDAAVTDEALDFVLFSGIAVPDAAPAEEPLARLTGERMAWLGRRIASSPIPVIPMAATCVDLSPYGRELLGGNGIHLIGGMDLGLRALGHALRWQERRGQVRAQLRSPVATARGKVLDAADLDTVDLDTAEPDAKPDAAWSEVQARNLLARAGIPLVPGELARSADEAVDAAQRLGMPVAMKICSAQITHKSDIGGVALGMRTPAEIREAYASVRAAGDLVPGARVDGVLVTPMRTGGVELLAGVTVDRAFGPVLAVGLGGVWVEVLRDTSLRVLPVDAAEARRMLGELRGLPLLRGARGRRAADLDALAEVISRIGSAAISLNGALRALEVNPLWVHGDQIEALDALVVTGPDDISGTEPGA